MLHCQKHLPEDRESGPVIGDIEAQLIEVDRAIRMGQPLYDVFDSYADTWGFFEALTSKYTQFQSALRHYLVQGARSRNVLLLTLIELEAAASLQKARFARYRLAHRAASPLLRTGHV